MTKQGGCLDAMSVYFQKTIFVEFRVFQNGHFHYNLKILFFYDYYTFPLLKYTWEGKMMRTHLVNCCCVRRIRSPDVSVSQSYRVLFSDNKRLEAAAEMQGRASCCIVVCVSHWLQCREGVMVRVWVVCVCTTVQVKH